MTALTVMLALDYAMKPSDTSRLMAEGKLEEARRVISEEIIMAAAHAAYDGSMPLSEARIFKGIRAELDQETSTITLDPTQFEFLCRMFFSPAMEERLRVRPLAARWVIQWMDYLESLR